MSVQEKSGQKADALGSAGYGGAVAAPRTPTLVINEFIFSLPQEYQQAAFNFLVELRGLGEVAEMLKRFQVSIGCDRYELDALYSGLTSMEEITSRFRSLALKHEGRADQAWGRGHYATAKDAYRLATLYWALADWLVFDHAGHAENYERINRCHDRYGSLDSIPFERVEIPFRNAALPAILRRPSGVSCPPVLIITQGLDTVKEFYVPLEEAALARGMATLNVDSPGIGEAMLRGITLTSHFPDFHLSWIETGRGCVRFIRSRPDLDGQHIGVYGLSLGGFIAPLIAATVPEITACLAVGGAFASTGRRANFVQQLRLRYVVTGNPWSAGFPMDKRSLAPFIAGLRCPLLVMHGAKDEIIPPEHARMTYEGASSKDKTLVIREEGDHCCNQFVRTEIWPMMLDWMAERLGAREPSVPRG